MDVVDISTRSQMMSGIKGANTRPEMAVRRYLHSAGFRFRLHRKDLPGRPDMILSKYRLAIFVHGCFWHRHANCRYTSSPSSHENFWLAKFKANMERDKTQVEKLLEAGWRVLIIWECGVRHLSVEFEMLINMVKGSQVFMEWPSKPPKVKT